MIHEGNVGDRLRPAEVLAEKAGKLVSDTFALMVRTEGDWSHNRVCDMHRNARSFSIATRRRRR